jgi:hypothetical protein
MADDHTPVDLDAINPRDGASRNGGFNVVHDGPRCGAKTRTGGECKKHPANGTKRCKFHGGATPAAIAKAEREAHMRDLEEQVGKAVRRLNIEPVEDPLTALKLLAGEVLEWKRALLEKIQLLDNLRYSTEFNEQIRGEVLLYERSLDRCLNVLATIAKLNIDERLAAVTESQAKMLEDCLFAAFEAAGVPITDPDRREAVAVEFGRHLAVAG